MRGALRFYQLPVQLPLELSDALSRVAQRSELLQLIDDLLHFVVNNGGAFFPGVFHKTKSASTGGIVVSGDSVPQY